MYPTQGCYSHLAWDLFGDYSSRRGLRNARMTRSFSGLFRLNSGLPWQSTASITKSRLCQSLSIVRGSASIAREYCRSESQSSKMGSSNIK